MQLKALISASSDLRGSTSVIFGLPQLLSAIQWHALLPCPAITAECLEIGRLLLQTVSQSPAERSRGDGHALDKPALEQRAHFVQGFKQLCQESLRQIRSTLEQPAKQSIQQKAMLPVLIESTVFSLLEACAAEKKLSGDDGAVAPPHKTESSLNPGFSKEDSELILASPADVQKAGLMYLLQMLTAGKLPCHTVTHARSAKESAQYCMRPILCAFSSLKFCLHNELTSKLLQ